MSTIYTDTFSTSLKICKNCSKTKEVQYIVYTSVLILKLSVKYYKTYFPTKDMNKSPKNLIIKQ